MPNYFTQHKNLPFLGQSLQIFFCSGSLPNRRHFYPHLYSSFRFKVLNMNLDVTQDTIKNHVSVFKLENLNKSVAFRFQISTMTKIYFYIDFIIQKNPGLDRINIHPCLEILDQDLLLFSLCLFRLKFVSIKHKNEKGSGRDRINIHLGLSLFGFLF